MEPMIMLAGLAVAIVIAVAAGLALRRRGAATSPAFAGLRERDFDSLVAEAFRAQGYEPIKVARGEPTARAGELVLRRERITYLVDCRHRHVGKIGVDAVQALQRAMAARGATGGFMLAGGRFSREAIAFAGNCGIRLVDGTALQAMLGRVKPP
jgi:restriction system protein